MEAKSRLRQKHFLMTMYNYIAGLQLQLKKEADLKIKEGVEDIQRR